MSILKIDKTHCLFRG